MPYLKSTTQRPWIPKSKPFEGVKRNFNYNDRKWKSISKLFRQENPLCKSCQEQDIVTLGETTDHIKPIAEGGDPFDWSNLQTLCKKCHNIKTTKEIHKRNDK